MRWTLLYYLLHFQFLFSWVFSAPMPPKPSLESLSHGDFVGVRIHTCGYGGSIKRFPGDVRRPPKVGTENWIQQNRDIIHPGNTELR